MTDRNVSEPANKLDLEAAREIIAVVMHPSHPRYEEVLAATVRRLGKLVNERRVADFRKRGKDEPRRDHSKPSL